MRILLFLVVIFVFLLIFLSNSLDKKMKVTFALLLTLVFSLGYFYEQSIEKKTTHSIAKIEAFKQGEDLLCKNGIKVNKKYFYYFSGTDTFSPKPSSKHVDLIIDLDDCAIEERR